MTKIVYNACYGGFSISRKAYDRFLELGGEIARDELKAMAEMEEKFGSSTLFGNSFGRDIARHDPILIQVVGELGKEASGFCAELKIEEIQGLLYRIEEYDGLEHVETPHEIDWVVAG